jgi:hypothetical protein
VTYQRQDLVRSVALGAAAAAQILVPLLGSSITGGQESVKRYTTVITPPGYAFSIWGPIYAGCAVNAIQHALPTQAASPVNRVSGWPLAGAYATNALWVGAVQANQFKLTPAILPVGVAFAATAYQRLQQLTPRGPDRVAPESTGLLLGWMSLAAVVNLAAGAKAQGATSSSMLVVAASTVGVLGAAAAVATTVQRSQRGYVPLGSATVWGLATTALIRSRPPIVRLGTALGSVLVTISVLARTVARQKE